jgi:hypothetical protein
LGFPWAEADPVFAGLPGPLGLPWLPQPLFGEPWFSWPTHDTGFVLAVADPVFPVSPELVQLVPLALPVRAPEVVTGLALADPVFPPLPESPDVGVELTVAGPVDPVEPVEPELPDFAVELDGRWPFQPWFPQPWLFQPWLFQPWLFQPWLFQPWLFQP